MDDSQYDPSLIDQAVLALLGAFEFENGRVWKRFDFDVMNRLFEKGLITNPATRAESVYLTEAGLQQARRLAVELFTASLRGDKAVD